MKRGEGFSMQDVTDHAMLGDGRCRSYLYHACITSARELGIYSRGRGYTEDECHRICATIRRLFPQRGAE